MKDESFTQRLHHELEEVEVGDFLMPNCELGWPPVAVLHYHQAELACRLVPRL